MSARPLSALVKGASDTPITGITADSRSVEPGFLFVAVPGVKADGRSFIADAIAKGAAAIVCEGYAETGNISCISVSNARLALAQAAAAFYQTQPRFIAAVTGTDGKTSTADFFRQLAGLCGHKAASLGTLGALGENRTVLAPGLRTTPDPVALQATLATLSESGYTHLCMEASSHGLDQFRLDGVRVRVAAFTNLTRDHLDYHGTDEAYFAAKARLFSDFAIETAVLNADDPRADTLRALCADRSVSVRTYGRTGTDYTILKTTPLPNGQRVQLRINGQEHMLNLPQVGAFQVYNMLAAVGLLAAFEEDAQTLIGLLPQLSGVPGRLQQVGVHQGGAVYVDYAHTPAALGNVLQTLRPHTQGHLIVVFGCGGERDKGKRPQMGEEAARYADVVIVTDDNPRSEDPGIIRQEILKGAKTIPGKDVKEVADRRAAIYASLQMLRAGDVLLLAGKGHETTQTIAGVDYPFDDAEVAREGIKSE